MKHVHYFRKVVIWPMLALIFILSVAFVSSVAGYAQDAIDTKTGEGALDNNFVYLPLVATGSSGDVSTERLVVFEAFMRET